MSFQSIQDELRERKISKNRKCILYYTRKVSMKKSGQRCLYLFCKGHDITRFVAEWHQRLELLRPDSHLLSLSSPCRRVFAFPKLSAGQWSGLLHAAGHAERLKSLLRSAKDPNVESSSAIGRQEMLLSNELGQICVEGIRTLAQMIFWCVLSLYNKRGNCGNSTRVVLTGRSKQQLRHLFGRTER